MGSLEVARVAAAAELVFRAKVVLSAVKIPPLASCLAYALELVVWEAIGSNWNVA